MNVAVRARHKARATVRRRPILPAGKPLETDAMRPGYRAWEMLSVIVLFALAVSASPTQAIEANAIEGRWRSLDDQSILDITRCGRDYCGQHVRLPDQSTSEGACLRTILNIKPALSDTGSPTFEGRLDLDDGAGPYPVSLLLSDDARTMTILGKKENSPIWSRVIPLRIAMVRIGQAACFPPPIS